MRNPHKIKPLFTDFNVSIIMPFYKKIVEFKKIFPLNSTFFEKRNIEVLVVMDSPVGKNELLEFIQEYPNINWIILINYTPHAWRNPAKVLNVGIKHASKKYIMVCSPESEMLTDVIYLLRKTFEDYPEYPHYAIGRVCYADNENITYLNYDNFHNIPFGSIMALKSDFETIGGYDEMFTEWGGDDNNLRARFNMIGINELFLERAMMIHRDINNIEGKKRRTLSVEKLSTNQLRHFFYPSSPYPNGENWGKDFKDIIYDYRKINHSYFNK